MKRDANTLNQEFHIVVMGAGGVGKSCLTAQFVHNEWIESYDPTIEDSYRTQVTVDGRQVMLEILDTAGTEQFVSMRDLYMKSGQGFLLVFSITSVPSLNELVMLREEIQRAKNDERVPIVLVGNKADLDDTRAVQRSKAFAISQQWGAPYYEASARTRTNVDEVFIDLCRQLLRRAGTTDIGTGDDAAACSASPSASASASAAVIPGGTTSDGNSNAPHSGDPAHLGGATSAGVGVAGGGSVGGGAGAGFLAGGTSGANGDEAWRTGSTTALTGGIGPRLSLAGGAAHEGARTVGTGLTSPSTPTGPKGAAALRPLNKNRAGGKQRGKQGRGRGSKCVIL